MRKNLTVIRAAVAVMLFLLVGGGRLFSLNTQGYEIERALLWGLNAALIAALAGFQLTDLVLARGMLQKKKGVLAACLAYVVVLAVVERSLSPELYWLIIITILSGVLAVAAILLTKDSSVNHILCRHETLPAKYFRSRPFKTIAETVFRLLPFPEPIGLYRLGNAGKDSPVFVTGNFELTVRRVSQSLKGRDGWLLVCDSRGINIWCASLAGHFGTNEIANAIKLTGLQKQVDHRLLILPELCAANVKLAELKAATGFNARFGPVYIQDINRFMDGISDPGIRCVSFDLKQRVEMAIGSLLILIVLLLLIYNFLGLQHLLVIVPILYALSVLQGVVFPVRPVQNVYLWALASGLAVFAAAYFFFGLYLSWLGSGDALAISIGFAYLVTEFCGWSPLIKYNLIPHRKPGISINTTRCTGCGLCLTVCPKGVFRVIGNKSVVVDQDACVLCKACCVQCPTQAIDHTACRPRAMPD